VPVESSFFEVKQTFEDWSLYETVIRHDYMRHKELAYSLGEIAGAIGSLTIVDLGCGDAWLASQAFGKFHPERYSAVDLSGSAVERARVHVASWGDRVRITCGNLAEFLTSVPSQSANLVLASNSLHHFQSEQKATIVRDCFRILHRGGLLCWADPVLNPGESRDGYLGRLTKVMQFDWTALNADQLQRATEHVLSSDFPETEAWMLEQATKTGFKFAGRFLQDDLFGAWKFVKPASDKTP
jgi:ubiquinone/menaquinone biosynthesis C-methylase UbiE